MASRLADIYKSEIGRGGGLGSTIGKRIGEKIDPRQMFDQSGLLTAMFPSLKAYNATAKRPGTKKSETNSSGNMSSASMGAILASSNLTAKNTMVLPAMARDMNLMRQNIAKMVKLQGGKPAMKGDMFFKKAGERNTLFESALGKMGGVTAKGSKGLNLFGTSTEKDGQTPESALYVKSAGGEEGGGLTDWLKSLAAGAAGGGAIRGLASIAGSIISSPTFIAAAAIGGSALLARFMKSRNDEELKKPENANVPGNVTNAAQNQSTAIATGNLTKGTANDIVKRLTEDKLKGAAADSFCNEVVRGTNLAKVLEVCDDGLKQKYLEMVAKDTAPAPAATEPTPPPTSEPSTSVPDTTNDARRGRGYIPPEPTIPSNAIVSGTGGTISTGSGGMVVSPSYETAPTPMPAPASMPRPTPAPSAPTPAPSAPSSQVTTPIPTSAPATGPNGEFKNRNDFLRTMYPLAVEASKDLGGVDPNALLTQWGFESAWGSKTSGKYNYFGIKADKGWTGEKKDVMTHEYLNGEKVTLPQPFRSYNNPKEAVQDYVSFLKKNKRYEKAGVFQAKTSEEYFGALQKAGYATDPNYASKLTNATESTARQTAKLELSSPTTGTQIALASSELTSARYAGRAQMRQQPPAPVVVNSGGSGDTRILTTQKSTPYNGEFYASLVSSKAL